MNSFVGVDGCRGGWYAVSCTGDGDVNAAEYPDFTSVLARHPDATIAVDIPIGLQASGSRACDLSARSVLSPYRHASVFSAPLLATLSAKSHAEASAIRRCIEGKGVSIQAFNITAKVAEVENCLATNSHLCARVHEVHPEVSFAELNGGVPMPHSKKTPAGRQDRTALLNGVFPGVAQQLIDARCARTVAIDDVLDAMIALWTAQRIGAGIARSLPAEVPYNDSGRRMAIFC